MSLYYNSAGKPVELGAEMARGGEGVVYPLIAHPDQVAKLYVPAPPAGYAEKLAWMREHPPDYPGFGTGHASIAWPQDLLYTREHVFVGYTMPYIQNTVKLLEVFNPRTRAHTLPGFNWSYLHRAARNLCAALAALHARGYVVGDLNEGNILVMPSALVTMIDTDSFQVQRDGRAPVTYLCMVGRPEYTPPELQGKSFRDVMRRPEHDYFGLGVLIYQMLMEGSHPFRANWLGDGDPPSIEIRIARGWFPWSRALPGPVAPPANAPSLRELHPGVSALVQRCFVDGYKDLHARPTPVEWEHALAKAEMALLKCPNGHYFGNHLEQCPRCGALLGRRKTAASPEKNSRIAAPAKVSSPLTPTTSTSAPLTRSPRPRYQTYRTASSAYIPAARAINTARLAAWSVSVRLERSVPGFIVAWVLTTLVGWLLGSLLGNLAQGLLGFPTGAIVQGMLIGIAQWSVLRHRLEGAVLWIPVTALGFIAGAMLDKAFGTTLTWPAASLLSGALQMVLLWRRSSAAPLWIVMHTTGWLIGYALAGQLGIESAAMVGLVNGILTGLTLALLLFAGFWFRPRLSERSILAIPALMLLIFAAATLFLQPCGIFDNTFHVSQCVRKFEAKDATHHAVFSPDGALLAAESAGGALRLLNISDGSISAVLDQAGAASVDPLFTADSSKVLTLITDTVQTWRVSDGELLHSQKLSGTGHKAGESITSAALSSDGTLVASGVCLQKDCTTAEVRLWRTADGASAGALKGAGAALQRMAFSPDSSLLVAATCHKSESDPCKQVDLLAWRLRDSQFLYVVTGHAGSPTDLTFSADGTQLASSASDGSVIVWRAIRGELLLQLQHTPPVNRLLFSADGSQLWGGATPPAQWRLPTGDAVSLGDMPGAPVAVSPDGSTLALLNAEQQLVLWRLH